MSYTFRKAVRTNTSTLIALAGSSGSGKTYSAIRLARGLVGHHGKVAVIDTEAGRALHYADRFDFDHLDMKPPFSPQAYQGAIEAAETAGYGAIIIDSMSHEWAGDGGCQDMHDETHQRMGGADQTSVLAWREAKTAHKKMVSRFLQSRSHLIFCLRAEEKIKFVKDPQTNKIKIEPAGWMPICEKNFMYEQTVSFLLMDARPGVGKPIKLQEQHKAFFNLDSYLDEKAGENLAKWAMGGAKNPTETAAADGKPLVEGTQEYHEEIIVRPAQRLVDALPHKTDPNLFEQSSAVVDHQSNLDAATDLPSAQRAWDDIVKDTRLAAPDRASLYARYQKVSKKVKGK